MSHFTTIKVQIADGEVLHNSLSDLGYAVEQQAMVRGYQGNKTQADYVIRQANGYDLGFRRGSQGYELVADFWGAGIEPVPFVNQITQAYAHRMLLKTVQAQGFMVESQESLADGTVRVVVGRWV